MDTKVQKKVFYNGKNYMILWRREKVRHIELANRSKVNKGSSWHNPFYIDNTFFTLNLFFYPEDMENRFLRYICNYT
jgi:hypothetical protein